MHPEALVADEMKSEQGEKGGRKRLTLFQEARKSAHMSRSLWSSLLRRIMELGLDKPRVSDLMRLREGRQLCIQMYVRGPE